MSGGADRTPDKANEEAVGQTSSTAPYSISAVKKIVDGGSVRQAEKRRCGVGSHSRSRGEEERDERRRRRSTRNREKGGRAASDRRSGGGGGSLDPRVALRRREGGAAAG